MRKRNRSILAGSAIFLAFGAASASAEQQVPPVPGAVLAQRHEETIVVPGPTVTTTTTSQETYKKLLRQYERRTGRRVVFYWAEKGMPKGVNCSLDPVKEGYIKVGGLFINTWLGNVIGQWRWRRGDTICNPRRGHDRYGDYITGTIRRCRNRKIKIYLKWPRELKRRVAPFVEFKSRKHFIEKNRRSTVTDTRSSSTTTTRVWYTCIEGYTLNGIWCIPPTRDQSGKDPQPGAGTPTDRNGGGADNPTDGHPGAPDSRTAPSYDCYMLDGNNDPDRDRPGYYNPATRRCQEDPVSTRV